MIRFSVKTGGVDLCGLELDIDFLETIPKGRGNKREKIIWLHQNQKIFASKTTIKKVQ